MSPQRATETMSKVRIPLRVVFYKEDGDWIAHCLEFDLLGDGATQETALDMLSEAIGLQINFAIEHDSLKSIFTPAESKYPLMFAEGKNVATAELHLEIEGVEAGLSEAREYQDDSHDAIESQTVHQ